MECLQKHMYRIRTLENCAMRLVPSVILTPYCRKRRILQVVELYFYVSKCQKWTKIQRVCLMCFVTFSYPLNFFTPVIQVLVKGKYPLRPSRPPNSNLAKRSILATEGQSFGIHDHSIFVNCRLRDLKTIYLITSYRPWLTLLPIYMSATIICFSCFW